MSVEYNHFPIMKVSKKKMFYDAAEIGNWSLLLNFFLTGLIGSFTHCIGMCGPIAIGQMSIRLMRLPPEKMTDRNKVLCILSIPYYIGKACSYSMLALILYSLTASLVGNVFFKIIGTLLTLAAALFFLSSALTTFINLASHINIMPRWKTPIFIRAVFMKIVNYTSVLAKDPFGVNGWILGFILGLIPCGLVYGAIANAISYSPNPFIVSASLFLFGLGTIPGLLLVACAGEYLVLIKWRKFFNILYAAAMLFNAYLLLQAAARYGLNIF